MSQQDIEKLLERFLEGNASEQEKQQVEAWLDKSSEPNAGWAQFGEAGRAQWLSSLYADIRKDINPVPARVVVLPGSALRWRRIAAVAAMLLVFFGAYLLWPLLLEKPHPVALTALKTSARQKQQLTLADGSSIWVNAASELNYPKTFNGRTREVFLSGEAYFDIRHDAARPFIIHTGKVLTTVLGTAFDIKAELHSHTVTVTVIRGKVTVASGGKMLGVLTPDQQLSFNDDDQQVNRRRVDAGEVAAWQQSELHFDDISFSEAAGMLEKRFGVKITFSNEKIKSCHFTGTYLTGDNLDKVLKVVCAFNSATYQRNRDGSISIDGPGCDQ